MYFNKTFAVLVIFSCWIVNGLEIRPTFKPALGLGSTAKPVLEDKNLEEPPVTVLEQYDRRYPDGSYEWSYHLSDGTVRYERGSIAHINNVDVIIVNGYYSYLVTKDRYRTVYYRADQNGYSQEGVIFSSVQPTLPQTLDVRVDIPTAVPKTTTIKKNLSITTPISLSKVTTIKNYIETTTPIPLILSALTPKPINAKL